MSSSRVPLLCAFGVGCLSTAVLFGFWQADKRADASSATKTHARSADVVTVAVAPNRDQRLSDDSAQPLPPAEPARVADRADEPKEAAPVATDAQDIASASPSPGGSAVSDVLMDLEAAYRQRLIAAARAEAEAARTPELPTTPPPSAPPAEPPREVATRSIAPVAAAPAPVAIATPAVEPPPVEPPPVAPPAPVAVAQNDVRPSEVHIGDVNQNTYITNVRQGDVYVIQQQLAMLNYMQLAGMGANPGAVTQSPHSARGFAQHQPEKQPYRQFPSTLTNPDNPWGFSFSPPNLVH